MISFIRDYLEILSDSAVSTASSFEILQITFKFFLTGLANGVAYLLTFGWIRDILYLPIVIPKWQEAILSEHFFSEALNLNLFPILNDFNQNNGISLLILGFLNSIICCLPLSTVHFLSIRRLFVQGVTAGIASILGMITGQCLFIALIIFGARSILIPWFNLDPLNYFLGIGLVFIIIYDMATEKRIRPVEISEQNVLIKIFSISLLLSWTEQATLGQYLSNINFSNQASLLTLNGIGSFGGHLSYIFGLIIGHLFFSGLFLELCLLIRKGLLTISGLPYSVWVKQTNFVFLTLILGCTLSSIPYYGLDYLITKPLGFISQDKTLEKTFLSGKNLKDPSRLLTSVEAVFPLTIDTNISHFDRDNYGEQQPAFFKRNFEELNYQGEYAWIVRRDRKPDLYASGETTKLRIRNLFQNQENETSFDNISDANKANQANTKRNVSDKKQNPFFSDFTTQSVNRQKLKKRFDQSYKETKDKDTYLMGDSFNVFPLLAIPQSPTEVALKEKYYANGVYKTLLNIDIDGFLNRQPKNYTLTPEEENQLFQKRLLLGQYYDTIRAYDQIPYYLEFNDLFQGSKSFVDRAYNHQFKGNLHVVRRLFAVTLDSKENTDQKSVLKYDMPLFKDTEKNHDSLIHEELTKQSIQNNPFLELTDTTPIYFGWDNETRQMVLTKRFKGTPFFGGTDDLNGLIKLLNSTDQIGTNQGTNDASTYFTTWPIQKERLKELKSKPNNRVMTLFEPVTNPDMRRILHISSSKRITGDKQPSLPINMRYLGKIAERLAPNHGGVVWPGN